MTIESLRQEIDSLQARIRTCQENIDASTQRMTTYSQSNDSPHVIAEQEQVTRYTNEMKGYQGRILQLEQQILSLENKLQMLTVERTKLEERINTIDREKEALQGNVASASLI